MNKKVLLIIVIFATVLSFGAYRIYISRSIGIAGLRVVSVPQTNIYLNDKLVGKTPYEDKHAPGEYILKLIPDSVGEQITSWQGTINLYNSTQTYVKRELGSSELSSAGEIVYLEKIDTQEPQIAVFSIPDAATVLVDGQERGITPLHLKDISAGQHDIAITTIGFAGRTVRVEAISGYKVSIYFQLALTSAPPEEGLSGTPPPAGATTPAASTEGTTEKPYVVIKDTETGFLRVRMSPSTSATEVAQIKPGTKFPFLEEKSGWFKINYELNREGWISGRYADKVE